MLFILRLPFQIWIILAVRKSNNGSLYSLLTNTSQFTCTVDIVIYFGFSQNRHKQYNNRKKIFSNKFWRKPTKRVDGLKYFVLQIHCLQIGTDGSSDLCSTYRTLKQCTCAGLACDQVSTRYKRYCDRIIQADLQYKSQKTVVYTVNAGWCSSFEIRGQITQIPHHP